MRDNESLRAQVGRVEGFEKALRDKADEFKEDAEKYAHAGSAIKQVEYLHNARMLRGVADQLKAALRG